MPAKGFHVDPGGACDDGRQPAAARDPRTPWCTVERALEAAPARAEVLLHAGTYPRLEVADRDRSAEPLTLRAAPGEEISFADLTIERSSGLRFIGLRLTDRVEIENSSGIALARCDVTGGGVWLTGVEDVRLEGNRIHDVPAGLEGGSFAIRVAPGDSGPSRDVAIVGNRLERLPDDGVQLGGAERVVVEGNTIHDISPGGFGEHADAIQVVGGADIAIRANDIRRVAHGLLFTDEVARNVAIENNVIAQVAAGLGMKAAGDNGMPGLRVVNNTWHETRYGVQLRGRQDGAVVRNNIFDQVSGLAEQPVAERNLVSSPLDGYDYGADVILEPPRWSDPETLELASGSPGVDAGAATGAPRTDRLGRPRRDDPATPDTGTGDPPYVDLGAHEMSSN